MNYNTIEAIQDYKAKIDANQQQLDVPEEHRALNTEMFALSELIKYALPNVPEDYEWWAGKPFGCLPRGPEFDTVLELAAADIRAAREPGAPETNFDLYYPRVDAKKPVADVEEETARREEEGKATAATRMKKSRLRSAFSWLKKAVTA